MSTMTMLARAPARRARSRLAVVGSLPRTDPDDGRDSPGAHALTGEVADQLLTVGAVQAHGFLAERVGQVCDPTTEGGGGVTPKRSSLAPPGIAGSLS